MNTPRTKKPKRYAPKIAATPEGSYRSGITNQAILSRVGGILTIWSHIEEQMVPIFAELTGIEDPGSARLVFRSIINHNARVDIMRAMLEKAPQHQHVGESFDKLIDDFNALAKRRNRLAHGLWYTHEDGVRVFLEEETKAYDRFLDKREITEDELMKLNRDMNALLSDLLDNYRLAKNRAMARALTERTEPSQPTPARPAVPVRKAKDQPTNGDE